MYTPEYMRHFTTPQNTGEMENPDAVEDVHYKGEGCFDRIRIFARRDGDKIAKINYLLRGCSGTIAACSAMSELASGLTLDQAAAVQGEDVARALGGVPERKRHSVDLAAEALRTVASKLKDAT
ncbi:MAG: iron-sulfur cluster assembly scaffold protein [Candidatus Zixiibacteriota bacterium]|nr:MAG: iron-sulfur cluster assembly scaffold protein [candidate division Zixibacteria bacterium]